MNINRSRSTKVEKKSLPSSSKLRENLKNKKKEKVVEVW